MSSSHDLPHSGAQRPTNRRWVIFALAAGTSSILYLHRYTFNLIRPQLEAEYGFSNKQLDSIFALFNVTYSLGQIPGGIVADLFGSHLFLGVIIAIWSLLLPAVGLGGSITGLSIARLGFGAAQAGCYPALAKVTRVWFPPDKRTIMQGLIASFFGRGGGAIAGVLMGTVLMGWCDLTWRASLWVMGLAGIAFAATFYRFARNAPEDDPAVNQAELDLIHANQETSEDAPPVLPLRRVIRNRSMLVFIIQQFMNAGADFIYGLYMGSYFTSRGVVDEKTLGFLVSLPLFGGACGGIAGGFLNDGLIRLTGSRRWTRVVCGLSGKTIATVCLYFAAVNGDPVMTGWLFFLTKFFSDWTQPTVWGASTDMGGKYSGTVFSVINTAGGVGGVVTPLIGGTLLDYYKTSTDVDGVVTTITHFEPVFIMVGIMYLASAACWLFINCEQSLELTAEKNSEPAK